MSTIINLVDRHKYNTCDFFTEEGTVKIIMGFIDPRYPTSPGCDICDGKFMSQEWASAARVLSLPRIEQKLHTQFQHFLFRFSSCLEEV
jgi:hypothetical protein